MAQSLTERPIDAEGRPLPGKPARGRRSVTVNLAESPLSWLFARGHLSERQFAAGEQLRADWERAQLSPGMTMRWEPVRVRSTGERGLSGTERQLAAKARFDDAVTAAGAGLADVLWRVVCAGESIPTAERALAWPVRSGKLVLRFALDRVAGFYRIG